MRNLKTTASAVFTAFFGFVMLHPHYFWPWVNDVAGYAAIGGLVAFGLSAKDYNVSGGTLK